MTEEEVKLLSVSKHSLLSEEKYLEAKQISEQITALNKKKLQSTLNSLRFNQKAREAEIEKDFATTKEEFTKKWNAKAQETEERMKLQLEKLKKTHEGKLNEEKSRLERTTPTKWKPSRQYLDLEKKKKLAATLEQYENAEKFKLQIDRLVSQESEAFDRARSKSIDCKVKIYNKLLNKEFNCIANKHQKQLNELKNQREQELSLIYKVYKKNKQDVKNSNRVEFSRTKSRMRKRNHSAMDFN